MKKILICLIALTVFSGCASTYVAPSSKPTAEISLIAENDSSGTTVQTSHIWAFKDTDCNPSAYGTMAGYTFSNSSPLKTNPQAIVANEPFVFTAVYAEARFAQNRECAVTAEFIPSQNKRYAVRLVSSNNVSACQLAVYDVTSDNQSPDSEIAPIDIKMPDRVCLFRDGKGRPNGRPLLVQWRVTTY